MSSVVNKLKCFGYAELDARGTVLSCSDAFAQLLGTDFVGLVGTELKALAPREDHPKLSKRFSAVAEGTANSFCLTQRFLLPNGCLQWYLLEIAGVLDEDDELHHLEAFMIETPGAEAVTKVGVLEGELRNAQGNIKQLLSAITGNNPHVHITNLTAGDNTQLNQGDGFDAGDIHKN